MRLCTGKLESVADKLLYARLSAGIHQDVLASMVGIHRATLLRYENGRVAEENMAADRLVQIALVCGMDKYFCCSPYHVFIVEGAGQQIKQYRKAMGLTQKRLASILGVTDAVVKRWEQNKNKPPVYVWELANGFRAD